MPVVDLDSLPGIPGRVLHRSAGGADAATFPGGWYLLEAGSPALRLFDADGASLGESPPPPPTALRPGRLAIDPDGGRSAIADVDRAVVVDGSGRVTETPHPSWRGRMGGAVAFDPTRAGRDRLWSVAPSEAVSGLAPQPPSGVLSLVDAATGSVLDSVDLDDSHPEGYTMFVAPERGVVLNGAYGQDGSQTWCLRTDGSHIEAEPLGWTGVACACDGATGELLFMPHDDPFLEVRAWGASTGTRFSADDTFGTWDEQEELGDEPDGYDFSGTFVDADRLVALTWSGRALVLDRSSGRPVGRLVVEGDDPDATTIEQVAPDRLLCVGNAVTLVAVDPTSAQ